MHLGSEFSESLVLTDSLALASFLNGFKHPYLTNNNKAKNRNHIYLNHFFLILSARILLKKVSLPLNSRQLHFSLQKLSENF